MSDKKLRKTVDELRSDVQELAESFAAFRDHFSTHQAATAAERQSMAGKSRNAASATTDALEAHTANAGGTGHLSTYGYYEDTSVADAPTIFRWSMEEIPVRDVLEFPIERFAQVLAAVGHKQRLSIILMVMGSPATANDVVNDLKLGTTGAAYHHLNVLQAAGLVEQRQRGVFTVVPEQVPVLLSIFAALSGAMGIDIGPAEMPDDAPGQAEAAD